MELCGIQPKCVQSLGTLRLIIWAYPPKNFKADDIAGIMGMQHKAIYEKMFPEASEALREKIARECYTSEIRLIADKGATLYPGVKGFASSVKTIPAICPE